MQVPDDVIDAVFDAVFRIGLEPFQPYYHDKAWEDISQFEKVFHSVGFAAKLRLVNKRYSNAISPFCLGMAMPNAEMRTKMIVNIAIQCVTSPTDFKISKDDYFMMYMSVFRWCTMKPPLNQSERVYNSLNDQRVLLSEMEPEGKATVIRLLGHVFKYIDRFYVRRLSLPGVSELLNAVP